MVFFVLLMCLLLSLVMVVCIVVLVLFKCIYSVLLIYVDVVIGSGWLF